MEKLKALANLGRVSSILIILGLLAFSSSAQETSTPSPFTGSPNQIPGQTLSPQADSFTGRFSYGIPIIVPPARQNSQPNIALGYNSSGGNSWCGMGWMLDMGYIQRDLRKGVPRKWSGAVPLNEYDDAKGFVAAFQGVNARLVNISGNEYRAEIDSGAFLKFEYSGSTWTVTDKSGTKFYFGEASASRMENPNFPAGQGTSTFRWALNRIRDANGNETTLTYTKDLNQLYLSQVAYNANVNSPALPATHTVDFILESRTDTSISFQPAYRVTTAKRLKEIVVKIGATKVRRYALGYASSASTYRSLLVTVTQFGADDLTALPPVSFAYQNKPFQFDPVINWGPLNSPGVGADWNSIFTDANGYTYVGLYDINGDALPDRVMSNTGTNDRFKVQLNTGSGFAPATDWIPLNSQGAGGNDWNAIAAYVRSHGRYVGFQDINGDGLPDRVMENLSGSFDRFKVQLNNGTGFDSSLTDWVGVNSQEAQSAAWSSQHAIDFGAGGGGPQYTGLYDVNGDGLADRVMMVRTSYDAVNLTADYLNVQLNTGSGFGPLMNWRVVDRQGTAGWNAISAVESGTYTYVGFYDINGDGLPDRVMTKIASTRDAFVVQLNNGAGFEPVEDWGPLNSQIGDIFWSSPAAYNNGMDQVGLYDINGDGLLDRVMRNATGAYDRFKVQLNTGSGFGPLVDWIGVDAQGTGDGSFGSPAIYSNGMVQAGLYDINGDGLPDRVMRKVSGTFDNFLVQLNKGPFPDLLSQIDNGTGGKVIVSYKPSTQYDNKNGNGRSLLPFVVWTASSITTDDGMGNIGVTNQTYTGGMFDPKTREFRGFNRVEVTDPLGTRTITYFHQGGGIDDSSGGEYQDQTAHAKQGIPYRVEVWGSDGLKYTQTLNKVEETQLHVNGWYFPFVSQTITMEYEGLAGYRAVAKQFTYDTTTLNLIRESNLGEVASVDIQNHTFSDVGTDDVYTHTSYAVLSNADIKNKPSSSKITSDSAGAVRLRETLFTLYDTTRGNLKEVKNWLDSPSGYAVTSINYDQYGNPITVTDPVGILTTTTFETEYRTFPVSQVTATFTSSITFDARSGQVTQSIDPKGLVTQTTYDNFYRATQTSISTTPNGSATLWKQRTDYSLNGITNGVSQNYVRTRVNDAVDAVNGHETYTYSDGMGRQIQTRVEAENGQFRVTDTFYNDRGQPEVQTLPIFSAGSGFTQDQGQPGVVTEYDAIGRAFRVTPPVGDNGSPTGAAVTAFKDGTDPWVTVTTDPEGKVRKAKHDAYGRVVQIIEVNAGGNYNTQYQYNKAGDLTKVIDHNNNQTSLVCDSLGRKTSVTDPDMGIWSYTYDLADRLTQQTDSKSQKLKFFYADPIGRLSSKEIYNSSNVKVATITYAYDTTDDVALPVFKGQLAKITDRQGWQKYGYDLRDRVVGEKRFLSSPINQTLFTQRTYDDADRVVDLTYPTTPTAKIHHTYDTAGHLSQIQSLSGTGGAVTFYTAQGFNALDQLTGITYGNGLQTTYTRFANSKRLQRVQSTKLGGGYNQDISYTFDKVSNVKSLTDAVYTGTASGGLSSIQYDDLYRLTSYTWNGGTYNFSYNPIGNVTVNPEFGAGTYTYGAKPHAVTSANGKSYGYDACGNMTNRNGTTLQYDEENQLKQYGASITFGYAEGGQRLWKRNGTTYTIWVGGISEYKGGKYLAHVVADGQRIATFEPQTGMASLMHDTPVLAEVAKGVEWLGTWPFQEGRAPLAVCLMPLLGILGITTWSRRQVHASCFTFNVSLSRFWKQLISVLVIVSLFFATTPQVYAVPVYNPVFYYNHGDHLGSSNIQTDRDGDFIQHYEYKSFGGQRFKDNTLTFSLSNRYTDQVLDEDTSLYYYNARYYDPELGRFIQSDSIADASDPQSLNRYSYVDNNPLNFIDPSGHDSQSWFVSSGGFGGSSAGANLDFISARPPTANLLGRFVPFSFPSSSGSHDPFAGGPSPLSFSAGSAQRSQNASPTSLSARVDSSGLTMGYTASYALPQGGGLSPQQEAKVDRTLLRIDMVISLVLVEVPGGQEAGVIRLAAAAKRARSLGMISAAKTGASLPADVAATFRSGKYSTRVLQSDVEAFRFSGGISAPEGRFLTTRQTATGIATPQEAIQTLNLPAGATAQQLNTFIIPKGTRIFYGRVEGGSARATQIFIENHNVLRPAP